MARPREFNRHEVLDRAMRVLWDKGIQATSISDLVAHMGIGRASIYDTFGSKEQLVLEAMDCYVAHMLEQLSAVMARPAPALDVIRDLLLVLVDRGFAGSADCCLMTKTALQAGRDNQAILARVGQFMQLVEDALNELIERGRRAGEIRADQDPRALARFLASSMRGIGITAAAQRERSVLVDVVEVTIRALRS